MKPEVDVKEAKLKIRYFAFGMLFLWLATQWITPVNANAKEVSQAKTKPDLVLKVGGISPDRMGQSICFEGTYTITRFTVVNNQLYADGKLNGPLSDCNGHQVDFINNQYPFQGLPVSIINGSCQQITITLGSEASFPLPSMKRVLILGPVAGGDITLTSKEVHHKFCNIVKSGQSVQKQANKLNKILGLNK